jgi:hypothetical protein
LNAVGNVLGTDADTASEHLSVTASPSSHVLHVTATAASAKLSAEAADAAVTAFVDVRRRALGALRSSQLRQLRLLVTSQEQLLAQEQAHRVVIPAIDGLFAQILELRDALDELEEAHSEPAEVVRSAVPPGAADYANTEVPMTSGAMLGLLCGCLLGSARDRAGRLGHRPLKPRTPAHPSGDQPDGVSHHEDYRHAA